ncbi:MAG: protein-L-isoaspartate O-methyltransferase [Candidatus Heimdallarchaeota archaeon]|nr:protein-L-isoaspartate O-methyltransferase [Candidatus Heimdallarchaeota archaeon]
MNIDKLIKRCGELNFSFSQRVLHAMERIDRSNFVESRYSGSADVDRPLSIPKGQTISAPHMVLMMLAREALDPRMGDTVLEIGTGSGYNAALLSYIIGKEGTLFTIERHLELVQFATANMAKQKLPENYTIIHGDGTQGLDNISFDKIIVTAQGPVIPDPLLDQLKPEGRLIIPVAYSSYEKLLLVKHGRPNNLSSRFLKTNSKYLGSIAVHDLCDVRFVKLIGEYGYQS